MTDPTERYGADMDSRTDLFNLAEKRVAVADMLDGVASRLHDTADEGNENVMGLAHGAADKVEATARYVRDHGAREMVSDVRTFVRKHPGKSLVAVAVIAFLAGRAFRRDD